MPGAAVVPEGHRTGLPVKAAGKLRLADMGIELIQQSATFGKVPALKLDGMTRVYVEHFAAALGVADNYGMSGIADAIHAAQLLGQIGHSVKTIFTVKMGVGVNRSQTLNSLF